MPKLIVSLHFTSSCLHHSFDRPICHRKGFSSAVSFRCLLCFSQRDLRQFSFLPASLLCTRHFFCSSSVCGQTDMIFAEPGLEDLASLVSCFVTECSGLSRVAALTGLPVEGCQPSRSRWRWFMRGDSWENQSGPL